MEIPELRRNLIATAYKELEELMDKTMNKLGINYYEMQIVFTMMDANVKSQNVASYIQREVTKLDRELNKKIGFNKREDMK